MLNSPAPLPDLSVILCSHNPNPRYLGKALDNLRGQRLGPGAWEFLLVDNCSEPQLAGRFDLSWHPQARHIREEKLGLTNARLCGIREARGDVLVFIDDDNVVASDFLDQVLDVAHRNPFIGAWNGQIHPAFEVEPPAWTRPYWGWIAIREFEHDRWANFPLDDILPCGAGLCVRRTVAERYATTVRSNPVRMSLDRKGTALNGSGDTDIALTACDMGLGIGLFTSIHISHIIPYSRLQQEYLTSLMEGSHYSRTMLKLIRGLPVSDGPRSLLRRTANTLRMWRMKRPDRLITKASIRGMRRALADWAESQASLGSVVPSSR
jgi:glycosyltransferase involved in cell wall biosynthesis